MRIKKIIKKLAPEFLLDFYHYFLALIGAVVFWFPSRKLIVIGITGTSGKSTTVDFITRILEENGNKVASISSIRFKIGEQEWKNELKMTMPGRWTIHKFLRKALKEKCKYAVLEVTSEGIRQHRHQFINFDAAVFTNLSPEHIESHGGFENYRNEKLKLFKSAKNIHVINIADENAEYFWDMPAKERIGFKIKSQPFDSAQGKNTKVKTTIQNSKIIEAEDVESAGGALLFKIQDTKFQIPLLGQFNIYNALATIAVAQSYGISLDTCKKALERVTAIPGRMEVVNKNPLIVVDYAHTPVQLESVYKTLKILNHKSKISNLICVLGSCGGGRDKWKRPVLGKIASQYCEQIILTNEDPYDENPLSILNEIESGFSQIPNSKIQTPKYEKILDRKEAIKKAVSLAKANDTIIITGKGSEPWMCLENGEKIPWDDREIAREELLENKK